MFFKKPNPLAATLVDLQQRRLPCFVTTAHNALEDVIVNSVGKDFVEFIHEEYDFEESTIFLVKTVIITDDIKSVTYSNTSTTIEQPENERDLLSRDSGEPQY